VLQGWLLLRRRQRLRLARCPGQRGLSAGVAAQTRSCCCWARLAPLLLLLLLH
jgi:ribosome modulation factor